VAEPTIRAARVNIAPDVEFGDNVVIEADDLEIGPGARIGFSDDDDFRTPPGVRVGVASLRLGASVTLGRAVRIEGGDIQLGDGVRVMRNSTIRVLDRLQIGAGGTVGEDCEISGRDVRIGQELWMLPQAKIGGGSAFERSSSLVAGHFLHLGVHTLINTARPVRIGHEVGLGTRTSIYTHGAYPSRLMGFPVAFEGVEIGDFTWVPGATVNPGVRIGRNCVVGVNSLVTNSIPDGSLAAGSPAKVIRENAYPRRMSDEQRVAFFEGFLADYARLLGLSHGASHDGVRAWLETPEATYVAGARASSIRPDVAGNRGLLIADGDADPPPGWTLFDTARRHVSGPADAASERLMNELRRFGIRFYSRPQHGRYADWEHDPPAFVLDA
jgi:acetyltransferase-like isoleucine patch superfamily enzyme